MKKIILYISIIAAAGLTMVTVYNSLVDFKSWSGDVPSSIQVARAYYKHIDPRNFFSIVAPINQIAISLTVILFWRSSVLIRTNFIVSFFIYAGIGALPTFYFIPRDIIIFARPIEGNVEVIKTALHQWQYMNWVRTALGLAGIFFSLKGHRLKQSNENKILQQLEDGLSAREKKKGQLHKVFKDSFDAKPIYIRPFLLQKIQYIHLNPGRGKWKLVQDWREYEHSSASFYELNKVMHYQPLHYDELY